MRQTLFTIPLEVAGYPLLGAGILLAVWIVFSLVLLAWLVRRHGFSAETLGYVPLLALVGLVVGVVLPAIAEPGGLPIRGYGVMLVAALLSSLVLAQARARRRGLDPEMIYSMGMWLIIIGIAGARVFYIAEYPQQYVRDSWLETLGAIVNLSQGGLVVYGSIFGGGLALAVFAWRHGMPGLALADLAAPSVVLGVAVGRLGCFLNGCCYGGVCDELPWAVRFPFGSPPHVRQVQDDLIYLHGLKIAAGPSGRPIIEAVEPGSAAEEAGVRPGQTVLAAMGQPVATVADVEGLLLHVFGVGQTVSIRTDAGPTPFRWMLAAAETSRPVHPAQLYSAIDGLLICLLLLAYDPFRRRDGELLALMATVYPITRFLMEIIRTDEGSILNTGMSISQNISIGILVCVALAWFWLSRRPRGVAWPAPGLVPEPARFDKASVAQEADRDGNFSRRGSVEQSWSTKTR